MARYQPSVNLGQRVCLLGVLLFPIACVGRPVARAPEPTHSGLCQDVADAPDTLPRYLTLELRVADLEQEALTVDGERVPSAELAARLRRELKAGTSRGVALVASPGVSSDQVVRVFREISAAGFTHVVVSGLSSNEASAATAKPQESTALGPVPTAAIAPEPADQASAADSVSTESSAADSAPADEVPSDVQVKAMGLHVGGGPNTDQGRERYAGPIAKRFDDFRRCHLLAEGRKTNASFGVDLLIGVKGGRAKIQD
ncbi:MAG: hypothetical protein RJA70_3642, partial [Pseudomonadota bacterium]